MEDKSLAFDSKQFLASVTEKPGVYRMLDGDGGVLYVGKAKNLKKRLSSYFRGPQQLSAKNQAMVAKIANVEVTATHTETEALILENNLIKEYLPPYNILLRDDKSYPYIFLSNDEFPRLGIHRGAKRAKGRYFGPYPSGRSVHESLNLLQKLFPVRQCENTFYRNRSRPCLQYQIKRCSGPCVGLVEPEVYQEHVKHAVLFLEGKSRSVIDDLVEKMETASKALEFEKAAQHRDQIQYLRRMQERQYVDTEAQLNLDVVAAVSRDGTGCVQVFTIRDGRQLGNKAHFPKHTQGQEDAEILAAFLPQYYLNRHRDIPPEIVLSHEIPDLEVLSAAINEQCGRNVNIHDRVRSTRARWVEMALENGRVSLDQRKPTQYRERLAELSVILEMDTLPERLECFDISHTQGEATTASCVVFDAEGPKNSDYRRFNIEDVTAGDDYAAMRQALTRRYSRLKKEEAVLPDIVVIDGGKGQLRQATEVMEELQLDQQIQLIGVAKGTTRKAGLETLFIPGRAQPVVLPRDSAALMLIQHIRDESHRFAITGHRQRRAKNRRVSVLEDISGIGAKRRRDLLRHFGGLQGVTRAGVEDLAKAPGISRQLAQKIYDAFHA